MGSFGDVLGIGGGAEGKGTGFQAKGRDILMPVATNEATTAYDQTQQGLQQQMSFLQALQGQNGIQNQSNVYNQLAGIASGTGPNPAAQALANATGQNVANQAALMAGQRGAGANAGLIARQAAQQGGALQQTAAGQGALMQAQQQLNAINAMGGMAGQQVAQQANATTGYNQAAQSEQQNIYNMIARENDANVAMQNGMNSANAGVQNTIAKQQGDMVSGAINGGASALMMLAKGGQVPHMDSGGMLGVNTTLPVIDTGPSSWAGKYLYGSAPSNVESSTSTAPAQQSASSNQSEESKAGEALGKLVALGGKAAMAALSKGGVVPAKVSPGEIYLPPSKVNKVASAKDKGKEIAKEGEKIPGKAKVKGDSLKNDTVSRNLEEGGIVIPRSIVQGEDAAKKAAEFVTKVLARKGRMK